MNVLIISRGIPSPEEAQWGSFEFDQARALTRLGHHVIMAAVDNRFRFKWRHPGLTINMNEGIKTYNMFLCPAAIIGLLGRKYKEAFIRWQWKKIETAILKHEEKIDIIYAHYLFNTYYAVHSLQIINVPIVAIEHWSELNKDPLPLEVQKMGIATYPFVGCVITVSRALKNRLQQVFHINAQVVYNMVGQEFYYAHTHSANKVRFITTGSLIYRKGFDLFTIAFSKLNLPKDKWQLNIIGEGKEKNKLQQQILAAGLQENIHLVGSKNKVEIAQMLNESDVFVLPSRNENFSVAVLEALACGLPVIASICGGIRECIDDKNGLLFEVDDVDGMAKALGYMYYHHQDYDQQAIADDCQARFSSEVIAKQLTAIFEDVVAKHKQKQQNE